MRRVVAVAAALAALGSFFAFAPPPAAAFPLSNCTLTLWSLDAGGRDLSHSSQGSPVGATQDNPIVVDPFGYVDWTASTGGQSLDNATYHIEVYGMPTPVRGSVKNADSSWSGRTWVSDVFPFSFQGTIFVSGALESNGRTVCEGSAWVKVNGDPVPGTAGAAALMLIGLAGAFWNMRGRHPFRGILAGLVFGAGLALLSGASGILPLGSATPIAAVVAALVVGFAEGAIDLGDVFGSSGAQLQMAQAAGQRGFATPPPFAYPPSPYMGAGGPGAQYPPGYTASSVYVTPPPPPPPPEYWATAAAATAVATAAATTEATSSTQSTPPTTDTTTAPTPPPGLPQLQAWEATLPPDVKTQVDPVFGEAQNILKNGPGTLSISGTLINKVLGANPAVGVKLADGAVLVGDGLARAQPVVENGKLSLSLMNAQGSTTEFLTGWVAEEVSSGAQSLGAKDPLAPLHWFVDNVNTAVSNAGQSIQSVRITPAGIQVTTGPAVH